jgi:AhpD family alkylhydroperoxidase
MYERIRGLGLVASATLASLLMIGSVQAQDSKAAAEATYKDIQQTLGLVPAFFKQFPESGIAGAWAEFKGMQLNPSTELSGKTKELIGLAVAAQIPCTYCVYFHTAAARANGASEGEIREAIAMAAIVRHWSTVLNGSQIDLAAFKSEVDSAMRMGAEKAKAAGTETAKK